MPVLSMDGVTAGYGPVTVLDGLSMRLDEGEVLAVLGSNGSGKSTALKTLMGLTTVTAGTIQLKGQDITHLPGHRRAALGMGYVPQTQNVFADLSVADNLRMGAFLRPTEFRGRLDEVFGLFPQLKNRYHTSAASLSGGERRMLAIGMTLLLRPRVLLLDEPSSDLSPVIVTAVYSAVRDIHQRFSLPIVLVEQNVTEALSLASRVCVLVRGREALDMPADRLDTGLLRELFLEGNSTMDTP